MNSTVFPARPRKGAAGGVARAPIVLASTFCAALCAIAANPVSFPESGSWEGVRYEIGKPLGHLKDAAGNDIAVVFADRGDIDDVRVEVLPDRLRIDASQAFSNGTRQVIVDTVKRPDLARYEDRNVALVADVLAQRGAVCRCDLAGKAAKDGGGTKQYNFGAVEVNPSRPVRRDFTKLGILAPETSDLYFSFVIQDQGPGPIDLFGIRFGTTKDAGVVMKWDYPPQRVLFRATFDGTADGTSADGSAVAPLRADGLEFAPGRRGGKAVRIRSAKGASLVYPFAGHVLPEQGSVAAWVKFEGDLDAKERRTLFSFLPCDEKTRLGTGARRAFWDGGFLTVETNDEDGQRNEYKTVEYGQFGQDDRWHFVVFSWKPDDTFAMVDGKWKWKGGPSGFPISGVSRRLQSKSFPGRGAFDAFSIGCDGAGTQFEGLIDDVAVFAAPLSGDEVREMFRAQGGEPEEAPDYAAIFDAKGCNKWECDAPEGQGGVLAPGDLDLEFVQEIRLDSVNPCEKFRAVGGCTVRELGGVKYIEGGAGYMDRFAVGLSLDPTCPLHAIEIDYPDDAVRTMGVTIQDAAVGRAPKKFWDDYRMESGVMTGMPYPNTGKILTHRVLWWTNGGADIAVDFANPGHDKVPGQRGAAVAAIRVYKVKDSVLPPAVKSEAPPVAGWNRFFALHFEDPALSQDFLDSQSRSWTPEGWCETLDRLAATMKFTGQNLFSYPGAWYEGLLGDEHGYHLSARPHPPYFWKAIYEKFDREGLFAMPTLNQQDIFENPPWLDWDSLTDGSLHSSPVSILSNGRPNSRWHETPPNFNIAHPAIQAMIERDIDTLVDEGIAHPSFKGVCIDLARHSLHWFGTSEDWYGIGDGGFEGGYNDYCIDAFEKAKGVKVPVDRTDPLRGRAYYKWIRDNAREKWIEWRCDVVSGFYLRIAEKMRRRRPDLKLRINLFWTPTRCTTGLMDADAFERRNREGGIDAARFRGSGVILSQTCCPSESRHPYSATMPPDEGAWLGLGLMGSPQFASLMRGSDFPAVHIYERYFESKVGKSAPKGSPNVLSCDWMTEITWRVETLNPAGRAALAPFVAPLAQQDILGFTKGGYLMGNYGTERETARFAAYFRALPAVIFDDVSAQGAVHVRRKEFGGETYLYVANTGSEDATATVDFGAGMSDALTGERFAGLKTLGLPPWEFRSFISAP